MWFLFLSNKTKTWKEGASFRKDLTWSTRNYRLTEDIGLQSVATSKFIIFGVSFLIRQERDLRIRTAKQPTNKRSSVVSVQRHLLLSYWFGAACFSALCTCRVFSFSVFYHVVPLKLSELCLFQCLKICCAYRTGTIALQPICAHSV